MADDQLIPCAPAFTEARTAGCDLYLVSRSASIFTQALNYRPEAGASEPSEYRGATSEAPASGGLKSPTYLQNATPGGTASRSLDAVENKISIASGARAVCRACISECRRGADTCLMEEPANRHQVVQVISG